MKGRENIATIDEKTDLERKRLLLFEYQQVLELFRHYDNSSILIASLLLPISYGLLALSFNPSVASLTSVAVLFAGSLTIYFGMGVLGWRQSFYTRNLTERLQCLESDDFVKISSWLTARQRKWWRLTLYPLDIAILYIASLFILVALWSVRLVMASAGGQVVVDYSLLVEGLVAAGTLALAILTTYQLGQFFKDRKAAQTREMDERVYTPLHKEILSWLNSDVPYGSVTADKWKDIKDNAPYLAAKISARISTNLNKIQDLGQRIAFLTTRIRPAINAELVRPLGQNRSVVLRIVVAERPVQPILSNLDPLAPWIVGKSLTEWSSDYVARHQALSEWVVEVLVDGNPGGGTEQAQEFVRGVFQFLDHDVEAEELRAKTKEVEALGKETIQRIEQEFGKPFAPWS